MQIVDLPHVLVVGETADTTTSMCQSLASGPYRCTAAIGSSEAVEIARRTGVDVALLDVSGLAPQEGLKIAARLRDQSRDLGVVLVAASRSLEDLVDALRFGVVDYLSKPVSTVELADAVQRAVEWRSAVQSSRGTLNKYEEDMAEAIVRIGSALTVAGLASTGDLDKTLESIFGNRVAALDHARRVAGRAMTLARALDVAEPLLGHIERAALLHDVGKLAIPKAIMQKSWPLSDGEYAIVRSYVSVSAEALSRVPFLEPTAEIVGATRESFDGRGYPRGLRGTAIPLGARVIAVAEAFDKLSGGEAAPDRRTIDLANAELVRGAGTRFDPLVVNAWLRSLDTGHPVTVSA
jgi:response regulator RpfG family c-di-GMP phosphodiesterase